MTTVKKLSLVFLWALSAIVCSAVPLVTDVTAKQRYPWNGLVDITCMVSGIEGSGHRFVLVAVDKDSGKVYPASNFSVAYAGENLPEGVFSKNGLYSLMWDARSDIGQVVCERMAMRVNAVKVCATVQLWEGGPYWSTMNIGAENPEDYGWYFWWGDTIGYKRENDKWVATDGSSSNFQFHRDDPVSRQTQSKDIDALRSEGWVVTMDGIDILSPEHDAAHVHWGADWRMPTTQEIIYLYSNCDWTWTIQNGVTGYLVRGRGVYASASIFLPAAGYGYGTSLYYVGSRGYYPSSTPELGTSTFSAYLFFDSRDHGGRANSHRHEGRTVRPVQGSAR